MSILLRISSLYPSLNDAERKVADTILHDPEAVRALSITRLGEAAGVSQTTVNRFCHSLGCEGYVDFKLALVEEMVTQRQINPEVHSDVTDEDSLGTVIQKVLSLDLEVIRDTLENVDLAAFEKAVDALSQARVIGTFGVGSSHPVAMDLYYRFLRMGFQSVFSSDSHMQAINAALLGPGDVAVAISHSGETQDTLDAVALAREAGATAVCLTNFPQSSLAQGGGICLLTSSKKTSWPNEAILTRLPQLALLDALCVAINRRKKHDAGLALEHIDRAVARKRR